MSIQRIGLVTGANRGIGFEICRQLAAKGISVILTSRQKASGEEAVRKLKTEGGKIFYHQLDVTDPKSIDNIYDWVKSEFGRLDILVNNAGIFLDKSSSEPSGRSSTSQAGQIPDSDLDEKINSLLKTPLDRIRKTLETNTFGPIQMIQKFVPLMKTHGYGRIVNLSSGMGQLSDMNGYWPGYRISKTALNSVTKIASCELEGTGVLVNSACPGWVKTDMGGEGAELSVSEGADTPVWLATLPEDGPTGGFFRERKRIEW